MCNSKFGCKSCELFHFSCIKLIFHLIFEEFLDSAMLLKLLKGLKRMVPKKDFVLSISS
jgi:hypothetical protein